MVDVNKMYTFLRGYFEGAGMTESMKALMLARKAHKDQTRKDGTPYVVHPLSMACYAIGLGIRDDNTVATILLHDVSEDCDIPVDLLPTNSVVRNGVRHMTIRKFDTDTSKIETKRRYFKELLDCPEALIGKAIDRYNNLSDMAESFTKDAMGKNCAETEALLMPVLHDAKEEYPHLANFLYVLRINLKTMVDTLKTICPEEYSFWVNEYIQK